MYWCGVDNVFGVIVSIQEVNFVCFDSYRLIFINLIVNRNANLLGLTNKTIYPSATLSSSTCCLNFETSHPPPPLSSSSSPLPYSFPKYLNFLFLLPLHLFLTPFQNISILIPAFFLFFKCLSPLLSYSFSKYLNLDTCLLPPPPQTSLLPPTAPNMSEL